MSPWLSLLYFHRSTILPESWVNLIRHLGLDFIPCKSFLEHALFSTRPAPSPGELTTNLAQLTGNSSQSVKHVSSSAGVGWEGTGVTLERKPGCTHHPLEDDEKAEGNTQAVLDLGHQLSSLMLSFSSALIKGFPSP